MGKPNSWRSITKGATDVNVIDPGHSRATSRRAKLAFIVTLLIGWVLATIICWQVMPGTVLGVDELGFRRIVAAFIGLFLAFAAASVVWFCVRIWPAVQVLIRWCVEITFGALMLGGFASLCTIMPTWAAGAVTVGSAGGPFAFPPLRRFLMSHIGCVAARHRVRTAFADFMRGNRSGSLPLIPWAWPTPAGARVWTWLRPGLSLSEMEGRMEQFAVTCWASKVTVTAAGTRFAALVRFDITYRNTFDTTVTSALQRMIPDRFKTTRPVALDGPLPTDLDLGDITAADVIPAHATDKPDTGKGTEKKKRGETPAPESEPERKSITDWLDDGEFGTGNADCA